MTAVDVIVNHHPRQWRHKQTGQLHTAVFVCPCEVVSVSENDTWRGHATQFVFEFEEADE